MGLALGFKTYKYCKIFVECLPTHSTHPNSQHTSSLTQNISHPNTPTKTNHHDIRVLSGFVFFPLPLILPRRISRRDRLRPIPIQPVPSLPLEPRSETLLLRRMRLSCQHRRWDHIPRSYHYKPGCRQCAGVLRFRRFIMHTIHHNFESHRRHWQTLSFIRPQAQSACLSAHEADVPPQTRSRGGKLLSC